MRISGTPAAAHAAMVASSVGPAMEPMRSPWSRKMRAASGSPVVTVSGVTG